MRGRIMKRFDKPIFFLGATIVILALLLSSIPRLIGQQTTPVSTVPTVVQSRERFVYNGADGKDALTLLKERAKIAQDSSGLVTSINGRVADNNKKEYWAFSVNGKLAPIGPAEYKTIDADVVEWRIEKY